MRIGPVVLAVLAVVCGIIALPWVLTPFMPWSEINCLHREVDIQSGRLREVRYLLWLPVYQREEETWLSAAMAEPPLPPQWRAVITKSPGVRHSPNYRYGSAPTQIKMLQDYDDLAPFDDQAKREVARRILELWQLGSSHEADPLMTALSQRIDSLPGRTRLQDLP